MLLQLARRVETHFDRIGWSDGAGRVAYCALLYIIEQTGVNSDKMSYVEKRRNIIEIVFSMSPAWKEDSADPIIRMRFSQLDYAIASLCAEQVEQAKVDAHQQEWRATYRACLTGFVSRGVPFAMEEAKRLAEIDLGPFVRNLENKES